MVAKSNRFNAANMFNTGDNYSWVIKKDIGFNRMMAVAYFVNESDAIKQIIENFDFKNLEFVENHSKIRLTFTFVNEIFYLSRV